MKKILSPRDKLPDVNPDSTTSIFNILSPFDNLLEVGIGSRMDVAHALSKNRIVFATDIYPCEVSEKIQFFIDDICNPTLEIYSNTEIIYALNLPPELHQPLFNVASKVGSKCLFTTLGNDFPEIPVQIETIPGETIYWAIN